MPTLAPSASRRRLALLLAAASAKAALAGTEVRWEETATHRIKVKLEDGREIGRWRFEKKPGTTPADPKAIPVPSGKPAAANAVPSPGGSGGSDLEPLELVDLLEQESDDRLAKGEPAEAGKLLREALQIYLDLGGGRHSRAADLRVKLARIHGETGDYDEAEAQLQAALLVQEETHGAVHPSTAKVLYLLGLLEHQRGRMPEAQRFYTNAIELFLAAGASSHPALLLAHRNMARLLRQMGRSEDAAGYEKRASELAMRRYLERQRTGTER